MNEYEKCPECNGKIKRIEVFGIVIYQCENGHKFPEKPELPEHNILQEIS